MASIEGTSIAGARKRPWTNAGAPTDGTSGTLAGIAEKGDLLIDTSTPGLYQNTNTQASPTWTAFAAGTGNTLDEAYDEGGAGSGRTITVDAGAVQLTNNAANNYGLLRLEKTPTSSQSGNLLILIAGANTTGNVIDITNSGSGDDISATNWSVSQAGQASFINAVLAEGTLPAGTNCYIARDNAGDLNINALTGKSVNLQVAGTDVLTVAGSSVAFAQGITGGLTISDGGADITGKT